MNIDMNALLQNVVAVLTTVGLKVIGAIIMWYVGRLIINMVVGIVDRSCQSQKIDPTIIGYMHTALAATLRIALAIAILSFFGVETTSFAAIIAAAGVAIGMAWSGLLSNFAAGVFLVILRPFKVGDFVTVGGVTGTVRAIGIFGTTIDTPDNVSTTVGNGKIMGDTIQNFTANPNRRVDLTAQLSESTDPVAAIKLLKEAMARIPNVSTTTPPECDILTFNESGPVLAVRPFTHTDHYWQVYFDGNKMIHQVFSGAGYTRPNKPVVVIGK